MAQATVFIYSLSCPTTGQIRYVGKSKNLTKRMYDHLLVTPEETNHRACWIRSLLAKNQKPILEILDEVPVSEWPQWEVAWIEYFREQGFNLTNATPGGEDPPSSLGRKLTPEQCAVIGARSRGRKVSEGTREKIRASLLGRKRSPEAIAKFVAKTKGVKRTPEQCARISAGLRGRKLSNETREKLRIANLGKKQAPEAIAKRVAACSGEKHYLFGKKLPLEQSAKLSAGRLKYLEDKKGQNISQ